MSSRNLLQVIKLPTGALSLEKNGEDLKGTVVIETETTLGAARALKRSGVNPLMLTSQAEIIEKAINDLKWGLGKRGYKARLHTLDM